MNLALASMGALFLATVLAYLFARYRLHGWQGSQTRTLWTLYANTGLLLACSAALDDAYRSVRRNQLLRLKRSLLLGSALALLFLVGQVYNWYEILALTPDMANRQLTLFTFYLLTGVHALHVVGGFVPIAWVLKRASLGEYSSSNCEGVRFCVQYWHFLACVWLLLLGVMMFV